MRHPDLYIRPLEPDDLEKVGTLLSTALPFAQIGRADIRSMTFEDPDYDPELTLVALDGGVIVGFAQGIVRTDSGSMYAAIKWFATLPSARRIGVMTTLFNRIEEQIQRTGASTVHIGYAPPSYVLPGVNERASDASAFLVQRGYARHGTTHTLRCDLRDVSPITPRSIAGISCARAVRSDLQPALAFVRNEFPHWTREVAVCFRKNPIGLFLARQQNELIGFASSGGYASGRGWIGPVGVTLATRGRGIGSQLLYQSLSDTHSLGHSSAIFPFDFADDFFRKACGATINRRYMCFEKTL